MNLNFYLSIVCLYLWKKLLWKLWLFFGLWERDRVKNVLFKGILNYFYKFGSCESASRIISSAYLIFELNIWIFNFVNFYCFLPLTRSYFTSDESSEYSDPPS